MMQINRLTPPQTPLKAQDTHRSGMFSAKALGIIEEQLMPLTNSVDTSMLSRVNEILKTVELIHYDSPRLQIEITPKAYSLTTENTETKLDFANTDSSSPISMNSLRKLYSKVDDLRRGGKHGLDQPRVDEFVSAYWTSSKGVPDNLQSEQKNQFMEGDKDTFSKKLASLQALTFEERFERLKNPNLELQVDYPLFNDPSIWGNDHVIIREQLERAKQQFENGNNL